MADGSWLVVGCGYVGARVLARLRAQGATLAIVTRDASRAASFERLYAARGLVGDYADGPALAAFVAGLPRPLRVLCLLPPSACVDTQGDLAPLRRFDAALRQIAPACAVLSSSTGVYGDQAGGVVRAETACRPQTVRELRLCAIEELWLAATNRHVLRCAGLYGPGRLIGLDGLRRHVPVAGDPDGWLNLLHVEDAASLLLRVAAGGAEPIELGADGSPVTRRVYYSSLAAFAGVPPPVFDGGATTRGGASRRCDPSTTCQRLAWRAMFRDFRAGLAGSAECLPV